VGIVDDDDPPPPSAERKGVGAYEESVDPVVPTPLPSSVSSSLVATVPLVVGKSVVPAGVPPIVGDGVVIAVVPVEDVVVVETAVETAVPDAVGTSPPPKSAITTMASATKKFRRHSRHKRQTESGDS